MITLIITLFGGIILGLILSALSFWLIKVNCPKCKQPQPLKEIIIFQWKTWTITGQPCPKCQATRTDKKEEIEL